MKKIINNLCGLCFLCVLCAACKGDYDDWASPQSNEQEKAADVQMTVNVLAPSATIKLDDFAEADKVQVFVPVKVESNVESKYIVTLSDDQKHSREFDATTDGYISREELAKMIIDFYGKKQVEHVMNGVFSAVYEKDGAILKVSSDPFIVRILPAVPDINYWIYGKQNQLNNKEKVMPLMPESKERQMVTTYFTGKRDTKLWSDDTFGDLSQLFGATGGDKATISAEFSAGGGYICPPSEGWYTLTFSFVTYTYNFTKLEDQNPVEYESISLIGDFNNWEADEQMTQVATTGNKWKSHCWYLLGFNQESDGAVKLRANAAWDVSWGGTQNVKDKPYGVAKQVNDNLTLPAGTYDIYFNDITGEYLFIIQ